MMNINVTDFQCTSGTHHFW